MLGCERNLLQMILDILIGYDSWYECFEERESATPAYYSCTCLIPRESIEQEHPCIEEHRIFHQAIQKQASVCFTSKLIPLSPSEQVNSAW